MAKYYGDGAIKEIIKLIERLGQRHSVWQVFNDFLEMSAVTISNSVDWVHWEKREAQYMEIVKRYSKDELQLFPQMFAMLVEALEQCVPHPRDILGEIFHDLELHNKYKGQFFTPQNVCDMMGKISISENDPMIMDKGYLTVGEPCVGSGAMVLGFAKAMSDAKYNYCKQMVVTATDVDLKCVHMAYLQFSLYGIPAVVIHGNTISMQEWSRWYTPVYMVDGWIWRQRCGNDDKKYAEDEALKMATDPLYAAVRQAEKLLADSQTVPEVQKYDLELKEARDGQMSLF